MASWVTVAAIWLVEPFLKSLKAFMTLAGRMSSEKVALMLAAGPTSPPLRGKVLMTLGAWVSVGTQFTVKVSETDWESWAPSGRLAVFVKVPHCVGITLMVATKG